MTTLLAQADPWQKYDNKKPKPGIPEPSFYGAVFVLICIVLVLKLKNRK